MAKNQKKKKKSNAGRKLFDGKDKAEVLSKLAQAFSIGANDEEACELAEISVQALYRYEEKNPEFREQKHLKKTRLILKARQEVARGIEGNPELAFKYLERKRPDEFMPQSRQHNTNANINMTDWSPERIAEFNAKMARWVQHANGEGDEAQQS